MNTRTATSMEREIQRLARALYRRAAEHKPSIFQPQDWLGKMIEWSLEDESLRVALFRFVDVLPSLESAADIGRHLEQYFARVDHAFGGLVYLAQALHAGWLLAPLARQNVTRLARRFIVEENPKTLKTVLQDLRKEPAGFTLDLVGEATVSDKEALAMQERHLDLIRMLSALAKSWRSVGQIDEGPNGPLPRVNLSVKVSSLYARFDPVDPDTAKVARDRLRPIFAEAARSNAALTVDMEQYAFKDVTFEIFRTLLEEDEFATTPAAGIAVQAYLRDSERDLRELIGWARLRRRRIGVRLVKGAYWDSEIAWARQKNWPIPVFLEKAETDANYERLTRLLLESYDVIDPAFGSHNIRSLAHAIAAAKEIGIPPRGYEIQMLYGMGEPIRRAVIEHGERVRVYLPIGRLLPGMAYLIRRLMENTSNTSFLRQTYAEREEIDELIAPPTAKPGNGRRPVRKRKSMSRSDPADFRNEPPTDFARAENRRQFSQALIDMRKQFGRDYPSIANGNEFQTRSWIDSVNPAAPRELIGRAAASDL
ncbi:MAG TPA: proline dehydrogenase family protein, partial [Candidatus Binatia bacterium]